jgi:hypothetical protein
MRNRLILISILLCAASAFSQTTTITGTIKDLTNTVVSSGKVVFTLKPSVDTTISGNARFTPGAPITCYIQSNGTLLNAPQSGSCVVMSNTSLTPAGTSYRVDICPYMACASSFNFYAINSSYDISTIVPTPTTGPAQNFADVFSNQTIAGNKTFTGNTLFNGSVTGPTLFNGLLTATSIEQVVYVDQQPGSTPDVQFANALATAQTGSELYYQCAPGSVLPAFLSTVTVGVRVSIKLGGCIWTGPSSGYMFDVTTSGVSIFGVGKLKTDVRSNSNTDLIHIEPAARNDWEIANLQMDDVFVGRTAGSAVDGENGGGLNTVLGYIHDNLINGFENCIRLTGENDSLVANVRCQLALADHFYFQNGNTTICLNCYALGVQNGAIGIHYYAMNQSGVQGGQCSVNNGLCLVVQGTSSIPSDGFVDNGLDAEIGTYTGTNDLIQFIDVAGWVINGGDALSAGKSGVHCLGGGGGVINGLLMQSNTSYGLDASGTSPLGNVCNGVIVTNADWNGNGLGNINDPNKVVIGNITVASTYSSGVWTARGLTLTQSVGTVTTNGTAVSNGTCQAQPTVTLTGVAGTGSKVSWSYSGTPPASWLTGITVMPSVQSNTVIIYLCNPTAGSITPISETLNVSVTN